LCKEINGLGNLKCSLGHFSLCCIILLKLSWRTFGALSKKHPQRLPNFRHKKAAAMRQ